LGKLPTWDDIITLPLEIVATIPARESVSRAARAELARAPPARIVRTARAGIVRAMRALNRFRARADFAARGLRSPCVAARRSLVGRPRGCAMRSRLHGGRG
jgi:hypothetical protein